EARCTRPRRAPAGAAGRARAHDAAGGSPDRGGHVRISQVCIDRPALASVMSLVIALFGLISVTRLQNRELPDIDPPEVSITTVFPGAAPEVVETSVTDVLEAEATGIPGVRPVPSFSREQVSLITIEFELSEDVEQAANDVRDRVARARQ